MVSRSDFLSMLVWQKSKEKLVYLMKCLFQPFGHDRTQQQILEDRVILSATDVEFPAKPGVTQVAQVR
jgi:hypothetical protein